MLSDDDDGDPSAMMDLRNGQKLKLIARVAIDVLEISNRDAWPRILVALSAAGANS